MGDIGKIGRIDRGSQSCSICSKKMDRNEVKFVMPSSAYNSTNIPIEKRMVCIGCYSNMAIKMKARSVHRASRLHHIQSIKRNFIKSTALNMQ